ncbi:glycosyltransferase family 2 protein [Actinomadura craniellae]|uniref:4,4'-diaponeurosporenoate glycosyltransferase n=1 Tax=Actinomadura craniellae TaxID=2231787 RepID=A0A365H957_9ACTN|nr:glycosyltransferase family A protein [Actinomadura craniellae]RAY15635.1 glycosyltransferase family 2 protein [Actinomadura craniellae]
MTTRVTVVVPTRDSARTLDRCLASVRAQTHPVELIVVDNGSTDATPRISARHADAVLDHGPERSAQRNQGWRTGTGEVVAFVDSDMVLAPEIVAEAVALFAADPSLGGLVIPELSFGEGFLAACRAMEKRSYLGDPRVEAARIFRRVALEKTGGYAEDLTAFEDWDLADRVAATGYGIGRVASVVEHDEGRITLRSAFAKRRYYGRWLPAYRSRPWARSFGRSRSLRRLLRLGPPPRIAGLLALKAVEGAGLLAGSRAAGRVPSGEPRRL